MRGRASGDGRARAALIVAALLAAGPLRAATGCDARLPAMLAYDRATDAMAGPALVTLDRVVSGTATPAQLAEGCRLFGRLLPRYIRLRRFAERCIAGRPDLQAEGLIPGYDRAIERARTYVALAHCPR